MPFLRGPHSEKKIISRRRIHCILTPIAAAPADPANKSCFQRGIHYYIHMKAKARRLTYLLGLIFLLCSCSQRSIGPEAPDWLSVPCEYRFEGEDQSILLVRAQVADFDSAKIVAHTLFWTVSGDTLCDQSILYPRKHETSESYTVFTTDRSLPINSVLRSVELFLKIPPERDQHKRRF